MTGGGPLRSASLLHYLASRYDVDALIFREPHAPDPARQLPPDLVRRVAIIDLPSHRRSRPARGVRNVHRLARRVPPLMDRFSGFAQQVAAALSGQSYAIGVIEHFWCAPYWKQIAPVCARTVLDLHNIESVWHLRCAQVETGPAKFAHRLFAKAAVRLERTWIPRFSEVLTTSLQDAERVRERAPGARITIYPNALPLTPVPPAEREDVVIFSGNLEYRPNISAVRFFRQQVWPRLRERWPGLVWRLIGKNPHAVRRWTSGDERIEVRGPVTDAIAELARAKIAVVPLLSGSGTRLKILEAWAAALPVVSTTLGAEGLPVQDGCHLLLADAPEAFADAISRLLECGDLRQKLGEAGRHLLEESFTWPQAWKNLNL